MMSTHARPSVSKTIARGHENSGGGLTEIALPAFQISARCRGG